MDKPKFSVIIVTYYHEKYIRDALDSVLTQKTDEAIEIIIGDDGSEDNTVSIIKEYRDKYPFISVHAHENWGLSRNLYYLLKKAKGEYIAILEGDDYWIDPDKLESQKRIIERHNCIATCCNCKKIDTNGIMLGLWNDFKTSRVLTAKEVLYYQTEICHPSGLMMKNIFLDSGDNYEFIGTASRMGGNHTGMINLLSSVGGLYYDNRPLFVWRVIVSEGSKNYSSKKYNKPMDYYESMKKYEVYDNVLPYNYERHIYQQYRACIKSLKREFIDSVGYKRYFMGKIEAYIFKIKKKHSF